MGYPHPDHLLRQLTSRQLTEWLAYLRLEPIGNEENRRAGQIAACIYNANRSTRVSKTFKPTDFFYVAETPGTPVKQDWRFIKAALIDAFKPVEKKKEET